jgi:hypothetical protein
VNLRGAVKNVSDAVSANRKPLIAGAAVAVALTVPASMTAHGPTGHATTAAAVKPTMTQLEPTGLYGDQSHIDLDSAQLGNAKQIVNVVKQRKLPAYAAVISVATVMQESKLENLGVAVDFDSLGLFQQRPSCGWGTPDQLVDPRYATNAFLDAMTKSVPDWQHTALWQAAQTTQQSAFPTRYAQWQDEAARVVQQIIGNRS